MNILHAITKSNYLETSSVFKSDGYPLDGEEIADIALRSMLLIMNNEQASIHNEEHFGDLHCVDDYAAIVSSGIHFPWKERITFTSYVDMVNDSLPEYFAIGRIPTGDGAFATAHYVSELKNKSPKFKNIRRVLSGAEKIYRVGTLRGYDYSKNVVKTLRKDKRTITNVDGGFAGVFSDGVVVGCSESGRPNPYYSAVSSYVIGLNNDKRYFWQVEAVEEYWDGFPAKVSFSVDESHVKSLFYSRDVPLSRTGRLRPILHWVSQHKRRISEGHDVDISKHLRGITEFSMGGMNFVITNPQKNVKK